MTKRYTIGIFLIIFGLFFFITPVFAQSQEEIAKKYGITFPIADLGNCGSVAACKTFCDNSTNQQACIDYAKKHKLSTSISQAASAQSEEEILKFAKAELGCSSHDACMQFCDQEGNMDRCIDFAAKHNLGGNASEMRQQMATMKSLLGCTSMISCMEFCNNAANSQKCMEVFKQAGFDTGGGYSNESPEVWCSKQSSECSWDGKTCQCGQSTQTNQNVDYASQCVSQSGCTWDDATKICSCTTQQYSTPADNPYTVQGGETIYKSECLAASCKWSDNPSSCDCSGVGKDVRGVSTKRGLLEQILDFILRR